MVEREPVTVVCSMKGWIRAIKGHVENENDLKFKEGDGTASYCMREPRISFCLATNGTYTLGVDKLPGRGMANRSA